MSIDPVLGRVTIVSVPDSSGSATFTVMVDDQNNENNSNFSRNFILSVLSQNDAPVFELSGDITVDEDFATPATVTVTPGDIPPDEEGQVVTYSILPVSVSFVNISIDANTGEVMISSVPNEWGSDTFTVTANDGGQQNWSSSQPFVLTVNPVNDPVTISTPIEDLLVSHYTDGTIDVARLDTIFFDIEDDELEYNLEVHNPSEFLTAEITEENKVVLTFGSHILNGNELTQFVGETEITVTATEVDPSEPGEPTNVTDALLVQDKIEPTFEIGLLQNTIAPGFMQFYLFHSEVLSGAPVVSITGESIDTLSVGTNDNLPSSPYFSNLSTDFAGTLTLQVSAEDTSENFSDTTYAFISQPIPANLSRTISLGRSGAFMEIPEEAFPGNDHLIVIPDYYGFQYIHQEVNDETEENLINVVNISTMEDQYQQSVTFGVQSESVLEWIGLSPGFYNLIDGDWEYIPTFVLQSENKIFCLIDKPGTYVLKKGSENSPIVLPEQFALKQNYPNPFNPRTIIEYDIPYSSRGLEQIPTSLVIYDLLGREVISLVDGNLSPGTYSVVWSGVNNIGNRVASGVYFYSIRTGTFSDTRKMILLR